uniref:Putative unclassified retrotransposon protein n=1 Tax=Oryza sativa subsp. indica TaxID=39946 RepID=C5NNP1_ORYSI|nr:putative unclassified retrotransposon protein [Oryza sativa Indica Group]
MRGQAREIVRGARARGDRRPRVGPMRFSRARTGAARREERRHGGSGLVALVREEQARTLWDAWHARIGSEDHDADRSPDWCMLIGGGVGGRRSVRRGGFGSTTWHASKRLPSVLRKNGWSGFHLCLGLTLRVFVTISLGDFEYK